MTFTELLECLAVGLVQQVILVIGLTLQVRIWNAGLHALV